jgi:hypothetical protein
MAHVFREGDRGWEVVAVEGDGIPLDDGAGKILLAAGRREARSWFVVVPHASAARVNGIPVPGMRRLRHKDEIRSPGLPRMYFSTEAVVEVVPFPGKEPVPCARCRKPIAPGAETVSCPDCRTWHHQSETWPCWTYAPRCSACERDTSSTSLSWIPDGC